MQISILLVINQIVSIDLFIILSLEKVSLISTKKTI